VEARGAWVPSRLNAAGNSSPAIDSFRNRVDRLSISCPFQGWRVKPWPHLARSDYPWQFRIEVSARADEGSTSSPDATRAASSARLPRRVGSDVLLVVATSPVSLGSTKARSIAAAASRCMFGVNVGVQVEGDRDCGMAEHLRDDLGMRAVAEHDRRAYGGGHEIGSEAALRAR